MQFRNSTKLKKQIEKFHVEFLTSCKIRIKFYPSLTQELVFVLKKLEESEHLNNYKNVKNDLYINGDWKPNRRTIGHAEWYPFTKPYVSEYLLTVHHLNSSASSATLTWVSYLSDLFSVPATSLAINYNCFGTEDIDRIMECHCSLTSFEIDSDISQEVDQKLAISILERQNATKELKISLKPTNETFQFDLNSFHNIPEYLEIGYSFWVKWEQVFDLRSNANYLLRSNFSNFHFKDLVEKWKGGWTPKWNRIMIEANEILDIDSWITDPVINLSAREIDSRHLMIINPVIHAYKFQDKCNYPFGEIIKNGYNITRCDKSIATVTVENQKIGWFIIQSNEPNAGHFVYSHKRTYYYESRRNQFNLGEMIENKEEQPKRNDTEGDSDETPLNLRMQDKIEKSGFVKLPGCNEFKYDWNDYTFIKELGTGASGSVFLYELKKQKVAIKMIHRAPGLPQHSEMFLTELKILESLKSPFIIQIFGYLLSEKEMKLILEPMKMSVESLIKPNELLPKQVVRMIIYKAICGIEFLLTQNLLHSDIKPSNMLLDENGEVKLSDFGISIDFTKKKYSGGTLIYTHPDVIGSFLTPDVKFDLWSIGISAMELWQGTHPFESVKTQIQLVNCIQSWEPSIRRKDDGYEEILDFVLICLDRNDDKLSINKVKEHSYFRQFDVNDKEPYIWIKNKFE
ncbi:hypothetical protein GCK72_021807 [Caenorhabditis remanei]|uniref:mitogen-activated protein kinase kinase n=1 Tax=Caenorhabditis remanei TaxID=31234 RepID=A0A6A5GJ48_CAERE|nr:hypothetical protein GCK72_021807 [Caenorhabditis remanei]KAF1755238.1 hypothetical protein GCK72_021807 [Caenorhabditis remanei]